MDCSSKKISLILRLHPQFESVNDTEIQWIFTEPQRLLLIQIKSDW